MAAPSIRISRATAIQLGAVAAIGTATVVSGGTLAPLFAGVLGAGFTKVAGDVMVGLIPNILSGLFSDKVKESQQQFDKRRRSKQNHDVQRVINRAIAACLRMAANDYPKGVQPPPYLKAIASSLESDRLLLRIDPDAAEDADSVLNESTITGMLSGDIRTIRGRDVLTTAQWTDLLRRAGADTQSLSPSLNVAKGVEFCQEHFTTELVKALKDAGADSDPAWFAVVLRFLGEIHADVKSIKGDMTVLQKSFRDHAESITEAFSALQSACESRAAVPGSDTAAKDSDEVEEIKKIAATLGEDIPLMKEALKRIEAVLDALAEGIRRLNTKADLILATLEAQGATLILEDRAPPRPIKYVARPGPMRELVDTLWGTGSASITGQATGPRAAAAQGDGGQGKSVLALAYAEDYADRYPGGCFRVIVENQTLETALARMIPALPSLAQMPDSDKARLARAYLSRHAEKRCLLIIDNVDRAEDWNDPTFRSLLPTGACHLIVTTRQQSLPRIDHVNVGKLEENEAREVLANFRPSATLPEHADAVASILRSVERLAVAVASVGALMAIADDDDWSAYAARLEAIPLEEYPDGDEEVTHHTDYSRRIYAALDDLFARLPAPVQLAMEYATLLPEDMIPAVDHINGNPPSVTPADWLALLLAADAAAGRVELGVRRTGRPQEPKDFVKQLQSLGLLTPADPQRTLWSLHRLHAKRCRERLADQGRDLTPLWSAIAKCAASRRAAVVVGDDGRGKGTINNPAVLTDQTLRWELSPLVAVCEALWQRADTPPAEYDLPADSNPAGAAASVGVWLAAVLVDLGRYGEAFVCLSPVPRHERAVTRVQGHGEVASCFTNLAMILKSQGDLPAARENIERVIAIRQKRFAPDHPTLAISYNNLAAILCDLQESDLALKYKLISMEIERKHLGEDHPQMAASHSNLAVILQNLGDLPAARKSMERAIAISQNLFTPDHPSLATRYSNLAMIQKDQGDLTRARENMERAIAILKKHFAPDHPYLAVSYSNLAVIQKDQGDLTRARENMERAIAIEQKHFTPDHPTLAISYNNLATICFAEGDRFAACENFSNALTIFLKHFNEEHPHVKSTRKWMRVVGCGE